MVGQGGEELGSEDASTVQKLVYASCPLSTETLPSRKPGRLTSLMKPLSKAIKVINNCWGDRRFQVPHPWYPLPFPSGDAVALISHPGAISSPNKCNVS